MVIEKLNAIERADYISRIIDRDDCGIPLKFCICFKNIGDRWMLTGLHLLIMQNYPFSIHAFGMRVQHEGLLH